MAASFPNAKKTFSQVVNGVTKLVALLFNAPYDEIEAIETFIGAQGCTSQSYTSSLKDLLSDYQKGCVVDYKGAADLYVRSGVLMIQDASGNVRIRRNTSDLTVDWTMIDTGSEAASTQYYVYAVADASGTTFTVKISTNATTPTGCTFYRKIGSFYNDGSSNIVDVGSYNAFTGKKRFDTGWFAGTNGTTYTKYHGFGLSNPFRMLITPLIGTASDGTNGRTPGQFGSIGSSGYGITVRAHDTNSFYITIGNTGGGALDNNGTPGSFSNPYVRVIAESLE